MKAEAVALFDTTAYPTEREKALAEWIGMPAFEQCDLLPIKQITVSFFDEADVAAFGDVVGQRITMETRGVNFPPVEREMPSRFAYVDGDDDAA